MYDTSTNFLNVHEWAYGATEVVHILSLAAAIGFIALHAGLGPGPTNAVLSRPAQAKESR